MEKRNAAEHLVFDKLQGKRNFTAFFRFLHSFEAAAHQFLIFVASQRYPNEHEDRSHQQKCQCGNQQCHTASPCSANREKSEITLSQVIRQIGGTAEITKILLMSWCSVEHRNWHLHTGDNQTFRELRSNSRGHEITNDLAALADAALAENENVLHGHHVSFHASDLRDAGHFARAIAHAVDLNHQIHC